MSATDDLIKILSEIDARVTYDYHRNSTHRCYLCLLSDTPRKLVKIGVYSKRLFGNIQAGDPIMRPVCESCRKGIDAGNKE